MNSSSKMKINKETQALNDTTDQIDLIDIYRTFHLKTADYIFFSSAHWTFSRIDHILGHKLSLSKFKKIEIIWSIFSNHNAMRLEINYRGKKCKKHKHMEAKQYVTKKTKRSLKKSKRKSKNTYRQMTMKTRWSKTYGMQQKQF